MSTRTLWSPGCLWSSPANSATATDVPVDDEPAELTEDQRAAIRLIASALPPYWKRKISELLGDDDDGPTGVPVPA